MKLFPKYDKDLLVICTTEFFSCFAFFGMMAVMILFFVHNIQFTQKFSYSLLGNFVALSYISALIGGYIGGRYLTLTFSCILGLVFYSIGCFFLIYYRHILFIEIGLTLIACGSGVFEPNLRNLLGIHFENSSRQQKDSGFITLHVFNTLGQISGPISLAYLRTIHPSWMFIAAGIAMLFGTLFFIANYKRFNHIESSTLHNHDKKILYSWIGIGGIFVLLFSSFFILHEKDVRYILLSTFTGLVVFFVSILPRMEKSARIRICTIFLILFGLISAEICFRQCVGVIDLFTRVYVNRYICHVIIPTGMFISSESFFVFILAIWVIKIRKYMETCGHSPSAMGSMSLGLFTLSVCFALLVVGIIFSGQSKMPMIWLISSYFFMAIGELLIIPISASSITLSPRNWRGIMMGVLFWSSGLSAYMSAEIGKFISPRKGNPTKLEYQHLFSILSVFAIVISILLYCTWQYWKKKYSVELLEKNNTENIATF